jgi:hypothetical protein
MFVRGGELLAAGPSPVLFAFFAVVFLVQISYFIAQLNAYSDSIGPGRASPRPNLTWPSSHMIKGRRAFQKPTAVNPAAIYSI